jgi:hypothetical protein
MRMEKIGFRVFFLLLLSLMLLSGPDTLKSDSPGKCQVDFRVVDSSFQPLPCKLFFLGLDRSREINMKFAPNFDRTNFDPGSSNYYAGSAHSILTPTGTVSVDLEPGSYFVIAGGGLEYSIAGDTVQVPRLEAEPVTLVLNHIVDVPGRISADFHVHSFLSPDSRGVSRTHGLTYAFPYNRIVDFLTSGVQLIVSSEHEMSSDWGFSLAELDTIIGNLDGFSQGYIHERIATIVGNELALYIEPQQTTEDCPPISAPKPGRIHFTIWPLLAGDSPDRCTDIHMQPATLYDIMRDIDNDPNDHPEIIQLNHPRGAHYEWENISGFIGGPNLGYFNNFAYDPFYPIPPFDYGGTNSFLRKESESSSTQNIDFDTIEILNRNYMPYYIESRRDWFSLLNQGFRKVATGNTDSHWIFIDGAGYPRNYVASNLSNMDGFGSTEENMIADNVLRGDLFVTTGPVLEFSINGCGLGDTVYTGPSGLAEISVQVKAAPWIEVDEVRLIANGKVIHKTGVAYKTPNNPFSIDPRDVLRCDRVVKHKFRKDAWIILEAGIRLPGLGEQPKATGLYKYITPYHHPVAFTNPIFVKVSSTSGGKSRLE